MTELFVPGAGLLFMKVGVHAQETLEDIIRRKSEEIEKEGFAMWGYGGIWKKWTQSILPNH